MLEGNVLVLNKSWAAVHIASARRAFTLLYIGAARAVHPHNFSLHTFEDWVRLSQNGMGGQYIHTTNLRIRVPEVILLSLFNGFIHHEVRFSRQSIFERDKGTCQYCGKHFSRGQLTIDHVMPQSRGGGDSWENLVLACLHCNVKKGNRTPDEANMPLLKRPFKPAWMPHFGARVPQDQLAVWKKFVDTSHWSAPSRETAAS
ncbi:MAG TPA: HNH endonuclease [Candidatus Hydrogenedentes bacterium]|nr:HNH endonuclease [Candidatus Hydrogenedentota bacterium]